MKIFVTVGTTRFDELVAAISSYEIQSLLKSRNVKSIKIQAGSSKIKDTENYPIETTFYTFKPSLVEDFKAADLIISHAGSGSILEILELDKKVLVVVNEKLMDNHQSELADELDRTGLLVRCSVGGLEEGIQRLFEEEFNKIESSDSGLFVAALCKAVGYN